MLSEVYGEGNPIPKTAVMKFFRERLQPRWGQPSLIWAALTMALLTLPVVIVSVEEAIKTIPRDLREASLALGATKFMTILRIVVPGALPGILTGTILTISRGAGEVAPILFTGVAYYLPNLPHSLSSQFMHLGYHIYVLATQSTNVELTKPLQYATTFVLLALTFALNFTAVLIRSRIRSKAASHS
jgi:phosphate transport system permease protein